MLVEIDWTPMVKSLAAVNWTAVLIALISGCAAVIGPLWLWRMQGKRESASVRASLFAEVAALVEIVDRRDFLRGLRDNQHMLAMRQSSMTVFEGEKGNVSFEVLIDSQYNRVYQGNVSRLGVLTVGEAKQIVRFHQLADSVRQDVIAGGVLAKGSSNPEDFKETADLLEAVIEIGRALVEEGPARKWLFF